MAAIGDSVISQYATQFQTTGNPQASEAAAKAVLAELHIDLTTDEFDALKARFMSAAATDPTADLPEPGGDLRGASGKSLAAMGDSQVQADIYSFMALFQKLAQTMRDSARSQRDTELRGQVSALMSAADQMKESAQSRYEAGMAQGISQVVGGVAQLGMSSVAMYQGVKGAAATNTGGDQIANAKAAGAKGMVGVEQSLSVQGNASLAAGSRATTYSATASGVGQGLGGIASGAGQIIAAGKQKDADLKDAEKAKTEAIAKQHETAAQHAGDMMQQMMDIIRDVRDKLQSMEQAAVETNKGIARNV